MSWELIRQMGGESTILLLFLMAIIVASFIMRFLAIIFLPDKYNPSDNKVLGGLAVLMVAVVADDGWIYFLSFFIAGLLIASERFMLLLAAVFNSDRTNVHKIPSYWYGQEKLYDKQELVETIENSSEEVALEAPAQTSNDAPEGQESGIPEVGSQKRRHLESYVQKLSDIEGYALRILKRRADYEYLVRDNAVVRVGDSTVKYDAIYVERETNLIKGAFEVKYFPTVRLMNVKAYLGNRARKYLSEDFKVGFIFVFGGYDHDEFDRILDVIEEFERTYTNAFVAVYQNESGTLTALYEKSLKKAFPTYLEDWSI